MFTSLTPLAFPIRNVHVTSEEKTFFSLGHVCSHFAAGSLPAAGSADVTASGAVGKRMRGVVFM
jgi:hypothetical protein